MIRSDGDLIKDLDPYMELIPYIMERRSDSQNYSRRVFYTDPLDRYIHEKREEGLHLSYLHVFIAASVRILAERPQLNRFIMNGRFYQRKGIYVSMVVKRSLREEGEETTVKFAFTGQETIFEVAEIIDRTIAEALPEDGATAEDQLVEKLMSLPRFVKRLAVRILKAMDRHNMLPKSIIAISPFHTSLFFTYLKSIKTDYIYHHLYEFGTTGIFMAMGKNVKLPVVEDGQVVPKNLVQVGFTSDDRVCDGLYLARSLKLLEEYIGDPALLETPFHSVPLKTN